MFVYRDHGPPPALAGSAITKSPELETNVVVRPFWRNRGHVKGKLEADCVFGCDVGTSIGRDARGARSRDNYRPSDGASNRSTARGSARLDHWLGAIGGVRGGRQVHDPKRAGGRGAAAGVARRVPVDEKNHRRRTGFADYRGLRAQRRGRPVG